MLRKTTTLLAALGLASGGVIGVALPAAAAPSWKSTSGLPSVGELFGVSCATATSCVVVGRTNVSGGYKAIAQIWNGTSWTAHNPPLIPGRSVSLVAVDCGSATNCMAVGFTEALHDGEQPAKPFAQRWNGTVWSTVAPGPASKLPTGYLAGVACPTATKCYAVGYTAPEFAGVIEHWNGSSWAVTYKPANAVFLNGISCFSAANCMAVGRRDDKPGFAARWNGTGWSALTVPNIAGAEQTTFNGVSCPTATRCYVTGSSYPGSGPGGKAFVQRWNAGAGAMMPSATTVVPSGLAGVACTSTTSCFAAGSDKAVPRARTLIEQLNGSSWTRMTSPSVTTLVNRLYGIACASATRCFAIGVLLNPSTSRFSPLILNYG